MTRRDRTLPDRILRTVGRLAAVAAVSLAVQAVPTAAHADIPLPVDVTTIGTSTASACQLSSQSLFADPLTATVTPKAGGRTDFVWHASAHAIVSSTDSCVTGVMVTTQLTDSTTVPNCPPLVQSPVVSASNDDPTVYLVTGRRDYEVDDGLSFDVPYFNASSTLSSAEGGVTDNVDGYPASTSNVAPLTLPCDRVRSSVTEDDTAYYANSQHQYIPYCSQQVTFDYVSTPAGPKQVGDPVVDSISC